MKLSSFNSPLTVLLLFASQALLLSASHNSHSLFREYIGAEFKNVKLSDVPVNPNIHHFDFILSFAIDYTTTASSPSPTNGKFNVFWDSDNLSPSHITAVKSKHHNVRVAVSLGGDTVAGAPAYFAPTSVHSWVSNAVASLTRLSRQYHLDGIDVDYEHFKSDPETFAECVGRLITALKKNGVISFASIAPFADSEVQKHYTVLWKRYSHVIDYVNFQFYAYEKGTTVSQFLGYFDEQMERYRGGRVLASFLSGGGGGLSPEKGLFKACEKLKKEGKLGGIFVWCADESKGKRFKYEKKAQALLAEPKSN